MRVPLSWLRDYVDLPADVTGRDLAAALISAGLEVETVEQVGAGTAGPIVVGRVLDVEELTGFKKPIRYCQVDVGPANGTGLPQNVVCGADNFGVGDSVVVVLPGASLPGGFQVGTRKTYGRLSEGMICSASELGLWEDHSGILVLGEDAPESGTDAVELLGVRDEVLDIAVTPDRGYALSMRGVAREAATLYGAELRDPAERDLPRFRGAGYPATVADPAVCRRYVLLGVTGFDPRTPVPLWMRRRLALSGVRSVSLAVDVTNYVMMEFGQPLHAWDRAKLRGPIEVRLGRRGERLETLDHVQRELHGDDILICDESGPINIAGIMGGLDTEVGEDSSDILIEAAHFEATHIARASRRHQLSSESSRRFERGIDSAVQVAAAARAAALLTELGGAAMEQGLTHLDHSVPPAEITIAEEHSGRVAGVAYPAGTSAHRLRQVGCSVTEEEGGRSLRVVPPTWRPDLTDPNDLAEEVIRLEGYEDLPSVPPRAPAGGGLTESQRLRRQMGRTLAGFGLVEVLSHPFVGERDLDGLLLPAEDPRRSTVRLANPLNEDEALLRTSLLPGLLKTLARNIGRGFPDVALFEIGLVYLARSEAPAGAPILAVDRGPTPEELAALEAALPDQPRRVGAVLAGDLHPGGWWGPGRKATWSDAVQAAREVVLAAHAEPTVRADRREPWHPGRCAALYVPGPENEVLVGHAGELHPRVISAYGLPARTVAMEVDVDLVESLGGHPRAPRVSGYPVATQDVALVVGAEVPAGEVESALRAGAGELLESLRLFDVYTGEQVGRERKSLAYTLRFRAEDRTLTTEEATAARDAAVAAAAERTGAALRG